MNYKKLFSACLIILMAATTASAYPTLQLDIAGGSYDTTTETIVSNGGTFTLYAYLNQDQYNKVGDTYFISAALVPKSSAGTYGSFDFNGSTINVTSDMDYGTPPLDALYPNLPTHDIYKTYYKEFAFHFSGATTEAYNTQDEAGKGPSGTGNMFWAAFTIDMTNLAEGYGLHFDLYNENILKRNRYDTQFAPFSHDAEGHNNKVPEPSTIALLGLGLAGLGLYGRNKK